MKPRVFFLLPFFLDGGVERWSLNWAKILGSRYVVWFIIHGERSSALSIPEWIEVLHCPAGTRAVEAQMRRVVLTKSDKVIAALTPSNWLGLRLKRRFGCFLVTSIHVSLGRVGNESLLKVLVRRSLYEWFGLHSDRMVAVSEGIRDEVLVRKPLVVYNPVVTESQIDLDPSKREGILAVGRLEPQKGFDLLIKAYAQCPTSFRELFPLTVIGEGSLFESLCQAVEVAGLSNHVTFRPFTADIFRYYRAAKVFVLSSRYEGFGNVLAEALASGCRCVSFDVPHGPREILAGGRFGILVPPEDVSGLSEAMQEAGSQRFETDLDALREHCRRFSLEQAEKKIFEVVAATK